MVVLEIGVVLFDGEHGSDLVVETGDDVFLGFVSEEGSGFHLYLIMNLENRWNFINLGVI